jgi:uncharacterized protein (DUF342 family)
MTIGELFSQYGVPIGLLIIIVIKFVEILSSVFKAEVKEKEVETKRDDTITDFSIKFDAERRETQDLLNSERKTREEQVGALQKQLTDIMLVRAKDEGKLEQLEKTYDRERTERDTKISNLEARIHELEKRGKLDEARILELEGLNTQLTAKVQVLEAEKATLETSNTELQTQVTYERNKALALSELVEKINRIDSAPAPVDKTQAIPERVWDEAAEDTLITEPKIESDSAASAAAEETKP